MLVSSPGRPGSLNPQRRPVEYEKVEGERGNLHFLGLIALRLLPPQTWLPPGPGSTTMSPAAHRAPLLLLGLLALLMPAPHAHPRYFWQRVSSSSCTGHPQQAHKGHGQPVERWGGEGREGLGGKGARGCCRRQACWSAAAALRPRRRGRQGMGDGWACAQEDWGVQARTQHQDHTAWIRIRCAQPSPAIPPIAAAATRRRSRWQQQVAPACRLPLCAQARSTPCRCGHTQPHDACASHIVLAALLQPASWHCAAPGQLCWWMSARTCWTLLGIGPAQCSHDFT